MPRMPPPPAPARAPLPRRLLALTLGAGLLAAAAWIWGSGGGARVAVLAKTWQLDIEVEKRVEAPASGWCDELPAEARQVQRLMVEDARAGRRGPAARCHYLHPQWQARRSLRSQGQDPEPPRWAAPDFVAGDSGDTAPLGSERLGQRHERYELQLRDAAGRSWSCRLPRRDWQAVPLGLRFRLRVDRFGTADCAGLPTLPSAP